MCIRDRNTSTKSKAKKPPKIRLPESVREKTKVDMKVTPVQGGTRNAIMSAAARLDSLVDDKLYSSDTRPNELTTDPVFLRRIYLDVAGRIPTLKEANEFLGSSDPDKRMNLIDKLLGSPGYVSNCLLYTSPSPRDLSTSRMPSSA